MRSICLLCVIFKLYGKIIVRHIWRNRFKNKVSITKHKLHIFVKLKNVVLIIYRDTLKIKWQLRYLITYIEYIFKNVYWRPCTANHKNVMLKPLGKMVPLPGEGRRQLPIPWVTRRMTGRRNYICLLGSSWCEGWRWLSHTWPVLHTACSPLQSQAPLSEPKRKHVDKNMKIINLTQQNCSPGSSHCFAWLAAS